MISQKIILLRKLYLNTMWDDKARLAEVAPFVKSRFARVVSFAKLGFVGEKLLKSEPKQ